MNQTANPYTQLLVSTAPQGFYGRRAVISAILHGISAHTPRSFSISGVKTIGKSNLARFLCHPEGALQQFPENLESYSREQLIPVYLDCYRKKGADVLLELPAHLRQEPRLKALLPAEQPPVSDLAQAKERLDEICQALEARSARLVLVLDHFDHAYETFGYDDETFLRSLATRHALVLFTEKKLSALFSDPERFSPLQNILVKRPLGMLSEREAVQFIQDPLPRDFTFSDREISFLLEAAGGHIALLNLACEHLYNLRQEYPELGVLLANPEIKDNILAQLARLPAVQDTFQVIWNHVGERGQHALLHTAQDQPTPSPEDMLQELVQTGLLVYRLDEQRYHVFCELFRLFIHAQHPSGIHLHLEQIQTELSARDRQLLEYLASRPAELVTFEALKAQVWSGEDPSKRAVEAAVHRVRLALAAAPTVGAAIQNERGKGYRFVVE
jgi:hypothetical protein